MKSTNITRVEHRIAAEERHKANGHRGGVIWLTGLSGSGKSTLAFTLEKHLFELGFQAFVLDGDNVRHGLCGDLGFHEHDRRENIRRVGEVAGLFSRSGVVAIAAFISPYQEERQMAREIAGENFIEVHVAASLKVCEQRDPKGLYKKARAGEIKDFTGIDAPYEEPEKPDIRIDTGIETVETCTAQLADLIQKRFKI
ncbi:adenylyl-sulfate kinase [Magnetovibrio sp. PR-2]|uniref:adenylyl-sulfate kinase n=1 Tax=Magnetovibrio sp. PR-2 TaxID=3120356 RepID=UPI002FCE3C28